MKETIIYKTGVASYNEVFTHLLRCSDNFMPPLSNTVDLELYSKKIVENSVTFEAWINNELVGLIAAYFNDLKQETGYITNVSTIKEYHGKGIASQLLNSCINYGKQHQFKVISLEVFRQNISAIQLYKKYDFIETAFKDENMVMKKKII